MSSEVPPNHVEIVEGSAKMWYDEKEAVFYNKIQVLNRDLSIQTIKLFSEMITAERKEKYDAKKARYDANPSSFDKPPLEPVDGITVLDALAATGLRSVRYLKEIPKLRHIHINDLLPEATEVAMKNVKINGISADQVTVHNGDATNLMYQHRDSDKNFDVIDLDPYGTASPFLDSAVQAVAGDGGLLCVTCTDAPVLSGNYPEVCFAKYGSMSLKVKYYHEMALRILLNSIETAANKYKRYIVPWLSLSVDYYVRVFVRVYESPAEVKNTCLKRIMTYQSTQCGSFINQTIGTRNRTKKERMAESKKAAEGTEASAETAGGANGNYAAASHEVPAVCEETGGRWKVGGPFWGAPIHDQKITDILLARVDLAREVNTTNVGAFSDAAPIATAERLAGMLTSISEELKDVPFYYSLPDLAATLQCMVPTHLQFKAALVNAGYEVSHFHHDANAFKTNAPNSVVSDIIFSKNFYLMFSLLFQCNGCFCVRLFIIRFGTSCGRTARSTHPPGASPRSSPTLPCASSPRSAR